MTTPTPEKLKALRALADANRELIDHMVGFDAPIDDIEEITAVLAELNALMASYPHQRELGHYNLAAARSDSNHTLPYSPVMGPYNPVAPPVNMQYDAATDKVVGKVNFGKAYEGPEGMLHGSMVAAVYDQILALASACTGKPSYTAYLNTSFHKPTPLYKDLVFTGWVEKTEGRKMTIHGQCEHNGDILMSCESLFITMEL